jgi:hypothetical protein
MLTLLPEWTTKQIIQLAPDTVSAQTGRQLAHQNDAAWELRASDGSSAWALYKKAGKEPYQIKIDLVKIRKGEPGWHCNCDADLSPCKHILGLLYVMIKTPAKLSEAKAPEWLNHWLNESRNNQKTTTQNRPELSPEQQAQRQANYDKRKEKIAEGLAELEQWLINLIRRGLADPQIRSYQFWDERAARMIDAQAPGIADWLREMGGIPAKGMDWIEPLLDHLGRLYLLIESFKRMDELSLETQADLRGALGWHVKADESIVEQGELIEDTWFVIGRFTGEMREKHRTQRIWLRGEQTGRDALIMEFAFGNAPFEVHLQLGWAFKAVMRYYPSRSPLRAFIFDTLSDIFTVSEIRGGSIVENIMDYAKALTHNPWLGQFPFVLEKVIPVRHDNLWFVRELDGTYLPIAGSFTYKWNLLALSGGYPLQIAGEWDGSSFHPTGALENRRFVDFGLIGKI